MDRAFRRVPMYERDLDNPDLPFAKPAQLEELEGLTFSQREAMDKVEIEEHVQDAADSLAVQYKSRGGREFDSCVAIVDSAITELGGSLGGKMGAFMVGVGNRAARRACREVFPEE